MDGKNVKGIFVGILSAAVGMVSIYGINPLAIGYFIASYAEGANGIVLFLCTILGMFFSASRSKILEYGIIFLVSGTIMLILKRKKNKITMIDTVMIGAGVNIGVQISNILNNDYILIKIIFLIMEIIITISSIIVLRKGITYLMADKAVRKLGKEEIISLGIISTLVIIAIFNVAKEEVNITTIAVIFGISVIIIVAIKAIVPEDKNDFENVIYAAAANSRLQEYSQALMTLARGIQNTITIKDMITKDEVNKIFDGVSEKYCGQCAFCTECWEKEFYSTYNAANKIVENGTDKGFISEEDLPQDFTVRCNYCAALLADTNRDLEIARFNLNWMNKMNEARGAFALQIREFSKMIEEFSNSLYVANEISGMDKKMIKYFFRQAGIKINDLCSFTRGDGKIEIIINAKAASREIVTMKESAVLMSEILNKKFRVVDNGRDRIIDEYSNITYIEEYSYKVVTGVARYTKNEEERCGDNYAIINNDSDETVMMLSDGMGTGEKACEESEKIVNIVEQFVETGFNKESSIKLLNSLLILKEDDNVMSTIDIAVINENTGICEFFKSGAAAAFVKRRKWVEAISSDTLPIGILYKADCDKVKKQLYSGDFVILMSDGVIEGITNECDKEEYLEKIINEIDTKNPQIMAEKILKRAIDTNGYVTDDMTVMVAGIWER